MRRSLILLALPALLSAQAPATPPAAEVKAGLGIEHYELTGAATEFKVAPGTKIYAWSKVSGITDGAVTLVFLKDGQEKARQELKVPHSPYRTHAYRTFRKGDGGAWTVKVIGADGSALGSVDFKVEIEAEAGQ
ncbi:MAG TPA: DUF2914 domain-containing protein [Holophagaceae bacterium]|nr:DUF2914 domain-containing protein [Holophagaceae bacterium]